MSDGFPHPIRTNEVEGHAAGIKGEADTEGHWVSGKADAERLEDGDDAEGHVYKAGADAESAEGDGDTEGHFSQVGVDARLRRSGPASVRGFSLIAAMVLLAAMTVAGAASASPARFTSHNELTVAASSHYHNGVFGQAAHEFCTSTSTYTPSHLIRTKIVRSSDGWSNTISSRYRKFIHCTAHQMTPTVWCTTRLVDGYSQMCITPRPKAGGASPCLPRTLDVRGVYHPRIEVLRITCVNRF